VLDQSQEEFTKVARQTIQLSCGYAVGLYTYLQVQKSILEPQFMAARFFLPLIADTNGTSYTIITGTYKALLLSFTLLTFCMDILVATSMALTYWVYDLGSFASQVVICHTRTFPMLG